MTIHISRYNIPKYKKGLVDLSFPSQERLYWVCAVETPKSHMQAKLVEYIINKNKLMDLLYSNEVLLMHIPNRGRPQYTHESCQVLNKICLSSRA